MTDERCELRRRLQGDGDVRARATGAREGGLLGRLGDEDEGGMLGAR